ncbi:MAG: tetratricopeptide repeat protein [Candidatus Saganbacteria bacterium]|nr:tetratricopeptide repeat protein [Candidatus Saganbacteria bacterium]
MKKASLWFVLVLLLTGCVWGMENVVDQNNLSLKAGPTEPGERLSLAWVESFVYPKQVGDDRTISLGVMTASPVKEVKATFDFSRVPISLKSSDGLSWSASYKFSPRVPPGAHVVRYKIADRRGSIQRTVEFFTGKQDQPAAGPARPVVQASNWPLTVKVNCNAYVDNSVRPLAAGQTLTSLSKVPWYKVRLDDGREGWIASTFVKEPTEDYYRQGSAAYAAKNYSDAAKLFQDVVTIDPAYAQGYLWLAKSHLAQGELDQASVAIRQARQLDNRDRDTRLAADTLARRYYAIARGRMDRGRWREAVFLYRKAVELKGDLAAAWLEMGRSFQRLGLLAEAREAWLSGLKAEPGNQQLRALLGPEAVAASTAMAPGIARSNVAPLVADESIQLIKKEKTSKGTQIETAIKSVINLTKSLGTPIAEKGWQIKRRGAKFLVSYLCEQGGGALESFDWLVDIDTRQISPRNENARVLMSRW